MRAVGGVVLLAQASVHRDVFDRDRGHDHFARVALADRVLLDGYRDRVEIVRDQVTFDLLGVTARVPAGQNLVNARGPGCPPPTPLLPGSRMAAARAAAYQNSCVASACVLRSSP